MLVLVLAPAPAPESGRVRAPETQLLREVDSVKVHEGTGNSLVAGPCRSSLRMDLGSCRTDLAHSALSLGGKVTRDTPRAKHARPGEAA